jgi:hypothetical protein
VLAPDACDRARDAVSQCFDTGKTTDRGVALPTQDVMVTYLPQRCQDEIREALEATARRASDELPPDVHLEFSMARAFCIVYDAGGQKGLKKHTDGRKEGATFLLLLSTPGRDFDGGGARRRQMACRDPSSTNRPRRHALLPVGPRGLLRRHACEGLDRRVPLGYLGTRGLVHPAGPPRAGVRLRDQKEARRRAAGRENGVRVPGCSVDAGDVEDGSWPAEAAQCVDPGHDAAIGAAECACVVS